MLELQQNGPLRRLIAGGTLTYATECPASGDPLRVMYYYRALWEEMLRVQ